MTVQSATNASTTATGTNPLASIGTDFTMFLKLLTTQMQNQDPLNPMDSTEYTQQLAQYSQVEQTVAQTGVLRDILARLTTQDLASASGFIGREATFDSAVAGLSDSPAVWTYSLPRAATSVTATITDAKGRIVESRTLDPSKQDATFRWDGTLASGGKAVAGAYTLAVQAVDASGTNVPATIRTIGTVGGVTSGAGSVNLSVNGAQLPLSALVSLAAAGN